MTFFIALFILLMQFLWKYVDDLVGKGLEWYIIAELLFYASATFVPLALPLGNSSFFYNDHGKPW
jgi:lipopolysaccharide export system permease protein